MRYFPTGIDGVFTLAGNWTIAIGSIELKPGPSGRKFTWPSFNGVSQDESAKRSATASAGFLSTLEMHSLMEVGLCRGAIESAGIRPREGSSGTMATLMVSHNRRRRADSTLPSTVTKRKVGEC